MESSRVQEKYDFLLATCLFKIEECMFDNCSAMVCSSDKEYKGKNCEEIFTCVKCKKTFCDVHIKNKQYRSRKWHDGLCNSCPE